ncbi:MAG: STAS domain-containing protein [Candidatus Dactylopiibacterium sp.]|nr:STAS domain-containing protein [Candidatus Dactylopiibacterium sp.]
MIAQRDGRFIVEAPLHLQTATALLAQGEALFGAQDAQLDLSAVESVDSCAIAVVLGWLRAARAGGHRLRVVAATPAFMSLASLYGVSEILFDGTERPASEPV